MILKGHVNTGRRGQHSSSNSYNAAFYILNDLNDLNTPQTLKRQGKSISFLKLKFEPGRKTKNSTQNSTQNLSKHSNPKFKQNMFDLSTITQVVV